LLQVAKLIEQFYPAAGAIFSIVRENIFDDLKLGSSHEQAKNEKASRQVCGITGEIFVVGAVRDEKIII